MDAGVEHAGASCTSCGKGLEVPARSRPLPRATHCRMQVLTWTPQNTERRGDSMEMGERLQTKCSSCSATIGASYGKGAKMPDVH